MKFVSGSTLRRVIRPDGTPARLVSSAATRTSTLIPMALTVGEVSTQNTTGTPVVAGAGWAYTHPADAAPLTPRRVETQWAVNGAVPQFLDGDIARIEFTVVGQLGAAAQPTSQDHWHVVCQLWGPADDPANPWDRFVKHGVKITRGKLHWYGGDAHPLHQWTQAQTREYEIPLADYTDGASYRIVVEAKMADHPDGWLSVWCNGVLWPRGEQWRPRGIWNGADTANYTGVKYTHAPGSWVSLRNGLYRGTNSTAADRPTYQQSVTVTPHYLSPPPYRA